MKKMLFATTILCLVCFASRCFSMPMRPMAPMTIEGTIQKISWRPERKAKGHPGMSGSAGHDRIVPAQYRVTLTNTVVTIAKDAKGHRLYKTGDTINITLNHPKDDNFLKQNMRVKIIDFNMGGDEGGVHTSFKKIVILDQKQSEKPNKPDEFPVVSYNNLEIKDFNTKISSATKNGEKWVYHPLSLVQMLHKINDTRFVSILMQKNSSENPVKSIITIVEEGYLDDSMRGQWFQFHLDRPDSKSAWKIKEMRQAYLCGRMTSPKKFSKKRRP